MVTGAYVQSKENYGYLKIAEKLGYTYRVYRPITAVDPISEVNYLQDMFVYIDPEANMKAAKPQKYGNNAYEGCAYDRTTILLGDYMVGLMGTFFVVEQEPLTPNVMVKCNRIITVKRPGTTQPTGKGYVAGNTLPNDVPLLTNWPASVLTGGNTETGFLPYDKKEDGALILLPNSIGIQLWMTDSITLDTNERFQIASVESTSFGYRIHVVYAGV